MQTKHVLFCISLKRNERSIYLAPTWSSDQLQSKTPVRLWSCSSTALKLLLQKCSYLLIKSLFFKKKSESGRPDQNLGGGGGSFCMQMALKGLSVAAAELQSVKLLHEVYYFCMVIRQEEGAGVPAPPLLITTGSRRAAAFSVNSFFKRLFEEKNIIFITRKMLKNKKSCLLMIVPLTHTTEYEWLLNVM